MRFLSAMKRIFSANLQIDKIVKVINSYLSALEAMVLEFTEILCSREQLTLLANFSDFGSYKISVSENSVQIYLSEACC